MKVSIVTPSFNQGQFIEHTILSVLRQDYSDFEYIVIDACSTDDTPAILERYKDQIDQLVIEPDDGQADAVRKGFERSSGDILAFLNSDDVLLPGTLSRVVEAFAADEQVDAIYSNRIDIDETDEITGVWLLPKHSNYCMSRWDFIPQETCFWRRSLMEDAGSVDAAFKFALDYELFVRMMQHGRFKRINGFLAAFRRHPTSKSTTLYETLGRQEVAQVQERHRIRLRWYDQVLKYCFGGWILGVSWLLRPIAVRALRSRIRFAQQR